MLYIYDNLRNELLRTSGGEWEQKVKTVMERSRETALKRFETPLYDGESGVGPVGWLNWILRMPGHLSNQQFAVFRAVHEWRDKLARKEDESPLYIMPQDVLASIARLMPPDKMALFNVLGQVAKPVRDSVDDLFAVIQQAKVDGENGPSVVSFLRQDSMAATLRRTRAAQPAAATADPRRRNQRAPSPPASEVRSDTSRLWGNIALSTFWERSQQPAHLQLTDEIALPWSHFLDGAKMNETAADAEARPEEAEEEAAALADEGRPPANESSLEEEAFTLRGRQSQKPPPPSSALPEAIDISGPLSSDSDMEGAAGSSRGAAKGMRKQRREEKMARRMARRARAAEEAEIGEKAARQSAKEKRSARKAAKAAAGQREDRDEPFDYSKAASVLVPKGKAEVGPQQSKQGAGKGKNFDPYGGEGRDELRPARRTHHGKAADKSATFKS